MLFKARRLLDLATSTTQGRSSTSPGSPVFLNPSSAPLRRPFTLPLLATSGKKSHPTHPIFLSPMHGFSPGPHAPRLSGSLGPACLFIAHDSDLLSLDARAPALLFATSLYGPAPGPRPGPRPPLAFLPRHVPLRAGPGPALRTSASPTSLHLDRPGPTHPTDLPSSLLPPPWPSLPRR